MKALLLLLLASLGFSAHGQTIFSNIPRTNSLTASNLFLISMPVAGGTRTIYFSDILADVRTNLAAASATTLDTGQGANELYDMDQDLLTTSSPTFPGVTLSPNGKLNIVWTNLATTPLAGLTLSNATAATAGVTVQDSPSLIWSGSSWLSGSASNAWLLFRSFVRPISAASTSQGDLVFQKSLNGGAFADAMTLDHNGSLIISGGLSANTTINGSSVGVNAGSKFTSTVNGAFVALNSSGSLISTIQANIPQVTKTSNYTNASALDSGLRDVNIGAVAAVTNFLPTAVANQHYYRYVDAAQIYSIKAVGSDVIRWGSTVSAAAGDIWTSQKGSSLHLVSQKAGEWFVESAVGGWTLVAPRVGNVALISGVATVTNATVTANSAVFLQRKTSGGTIGMSITYTLSAGTSFTITSDNVLDTSTYTWKLEEVPN